MAPKRLKEDPPPATTSGEEEEEESDEDAESKEEEVEKQKEQSEDEEEEDEDEDDDDEEEESPPKKTTVTAPTSLSKIVSKPQPSSGSESESESDSETEKSTPSPSTADFTIKPIASKPMGDPPNSNKLNNNNDSTPISVHASLLKRGAETDRNSTKDRKKRKVSASSITNGEDEDLKKASGPIQRLWGEEDELAVLKGMIEFESKKGSDPSADMGAFHDFIKKNLRVEVSKAQLMDKIRRMKKKYKTNMEKGGEDMVFSKPHESKSFELSKKIWGLEANKKAEPPSNRKGKTNNSTLVALALPKQDVVMGARKEGLDNGEEKGDERMKDSQASYPCLNAAFETIAAKGVSGFDKKFMRDLMGGIGSAKARELENKCRKVRDAELEVYVKRMESFHELGKLMLEALKKKA
ncbi:Mediator-associated protein 1 [Morella rubra]|uniref:Mediator-associated protein 1 n=1 Tax=Morella rubra TaxID=262757 RepID=A0A6A1VBC4_9ROSI|nr:Mediator-associated protein 1 [Morella rubra]